MPPRPKCSRLSATTRTAPIRPRNVTTRSPKRRSTPGDYENAIELLTALGDYQDSADLISQATDKIITAKLVGNWVSDDIDVTDIFVTAFNSALNPDSADAIMADVDLGTVTMTLTIEVTDKGSFYLKVDGQSLDATVDQGSRRISGRLHQMGRGCLH